MSAATELIAWEEKNRPPLDEIIDVNGNIPKIENRINRGIFQHFLFIGPPGTGKTSAAYGTAEKWLEFHNPQGSGLSYASRSEQIKYFNASQMGIDDIRKKIETYMSIQGLMVFILDEFDGITKSAQHALRPVMEQAKRQKSKKLFILTGNYLTKIIDPIISRCGGEVFVFPKVPEDLARKRLIEICRKEKVVKFTMPDSVVTKSEQKERLNNFLTSLYHASKGDLRKAVGLLQSHTIVNDDGVISLDVTNDVVDLTTNAFGIVLDQILLSDGIVSYVEIVNAIDELLYSKNDKKKGTVWEPATFFDESWKWLSDRSDQFPDRILMVFADIIGEFEFRMTQGTSIHIQLTAMLSRMRNYLLDNLFKKQMEIE